MSTPKTVRFLAQHHPSRPRLFGLGYLQLPDGLPYESLFAIATLPGMRANDVAGLVDALNGAMFTGDGLKAVDLGKLPPAIAAAITDAFPDPELVAREAIPDFAKLWAIPLEEEQPYAYHESKYTGVWTPRTMGLLWHAATFEADSASGEVDEEKTDLWIFGNLPEVTQSYPSWWRQKIVDTLYRIAEDLGHGKLPALKTLADHFAWLEIVESAKADEQDMPLAEVVPWILELPQHDNDFQWDDVQDLDGRLDWEDVEVVKYEGENAPKTPEEWFVELDRDRGLPW